MKREMSVVSPGKDVVLGCWSDVGVVAQMEVCSRWYEGQPREVGLSAA